ncbi:MAG TPA: 5-(carboxyamino)imidazole ribonucleotide synthase [Steroidobacteraceae bacterium]|nr:5-(carboxyamino)imidazole ribonucleotide synthase [Steroidobacteraceae bacterium]
MRIGVIGAGQLGRMLALAGIPLGLQFRFLDRNPAAPAGQLAPLVVGEFEDRTRLAELASQVDLITFDWENVSVEALGAIGTRVPVLPPPPALAVSQDRLLEKQLFRELGIPTPASAAVATRAEFTAALRHIGVPGVLKTRRLGYDGKGQFVVRTERDADAAWSALGQYALIYEAFVDFTREVSLIAVRSTSGAVAFYPLSANTHSNGILNHTVAPWTDRKLQSEAQRHLRRLLTRLDYAGVLTVEFFVVRGRLLANEIAPRVHNSGHWTIEGAITSQFENHLRAILGWPLGNTAPLGHAAMINFVGKLPARERWLGERSLFFHDYGKEPRPGRKIGHCTILETSAKRRDARLKRLLQAYRKA